MIMKRVSMSRDWRCPILWKSELQSVLPMALIPILIGAARESVSLAVRLTLLVHVVLRRLVSLCSPCLSSCRHWFQGSSAKRARNFLHRKNEVRAIRQELTQLLVPMQRDAPANSYDSPLENFHIHLRQLFQSIASNVQVLALNCAVGRPCLCSFRRWLFYVELCQSPNAPDLGNGAHCTFAKSIVRLAVRRDKVPKRFDVRIAGLRLLSMCHNLFDLCGHSIANIHQFLLPFARVVRREIVLSCDGIKLPKISIA